MVASTKDTSTATVISTNISCSNCPRISTPENTSQAPTWNDLESFGHFYSELEKTKKDVTAIRAEQERNKDFIRRMAALAKTSRVAIIVLMVLPVLQLVLCAAIVYYLGIQENLSGLINWIIGGIGALSFLEVLITAVKYFSLENKVNDFEKRLDKLETK